MRKALLVALVFLYTATPFATPVEAGSDKNRTECLDCLITGIYKDTRHVLTSPFHWSEKNLLTFTALSVGTFGLMLADNELQDWVQDHRSSTTNRVSRWSNRQMRRVKNLTIGGFYLSGIVFKNQKAKETALFCLESVFLAEWITAGIKHLVGRTRPAANKGAFDFNPLKFPAPATSLSFPSGHATTAFALSSVIAEQYRSTPLTIALYGSATVASLARVNDNLHFMSDLLWGGVIGVWVGKTIVDFNRKDTSENVRIGLLNKPGLLGMEVVVSIR